MQPLGWIFANVLQLKIMAGCDNAWAEKLKKFKLQQQIFYNFS